MIIIQTNCDKKEEAEMISRALLKDKLAFVAHICPSNSLYLWKGKIIEGKEFILNVRTTEENARAAIELIKNMHSYEVPPIVAMPVDNASKEYIETVNKELKK